MSEKSPHVQTWLSLLFIALTSRWEHVGAYNTTCPLPQPSVGEPSRPTVSKQFTVHVEATFLDKNKTVEFIEYFDYDHNVGRLRQIEDGAIADYYYDYRTNEMLIVWPDLYRCQVQQLNTSNYVYLLGDNQGHIFSPSAALRFGQPGSPEVYVGRSTVRGINVHQWKSCQNWAQVNTFMTITWSFLDNMAWVSSGAASDVPVECHVTGKVYSDDGSYRSFEHIYEFVHFYDNVPPDSMHVFETPSGVVCEGRINTSPLPSLPNAMQFTGESISEERKVITYTQEKYDAKGRIVSYEYRGYTAFTAKYGTDTLSVVNDFNTGTGYILDLKRGNCTITDLTSTSDVTLDRDPVTLRLKSATSVLGLSGNFTYQGQRTVRGIPCDVWITQKSGKDLLGLPVNATYEWALSTASWHNMNEPSGVKAIPIQLIYTAEDYGSRQQTVTNVYDYVASVNDVFEGINLDGCFIGMPRNNIVFSISSMYRTLLQYFQTGFKYAVRHSIAQIISVSPLRVADVQYRLQQFSVDVSFDLLSVPPVHSQGMDPTKERSLDDATRDLETAIKSKLLVIQLFGDDLLQPTFIAVDPNSLRVTRLNQVREVTGGPVPTPRPVIVSNGTTTTSGTHGVQNLCDLYVAADEGYSAGVMAGSAIAMGVVGGALALLTYRLLLRPVGR